MPESWWRTVGLNLVLAGTAAAGVALIGREVYIMVKRGSRVGPETYPDDHGIIQVPPGSLAKAAGLPLDVYALARCLSSEHGRDNVETKIAVAWAVKNEARASGRSIFAQLTRQPGDGITNVANGLFSGQDVPGPNKYASTRLDPYEQEAQIAAAVVAGTIIDPTRGATNFFSPKGQRASHAKNPAGNLPPDQLIASWEAKGLRPVDVEGTDPDTVMFFRSA